ncbi:unnamed protein product, partial [Brenthis ino]
MELLQELAEGGFIEECLNIFIEFCNDTKYKKYIEPNVPLSMLERGAELEVRAQKSGEFHFSPSLPFQKCPPTSALIASLADVVHNITTYKNAPVQAWNDQGLYRVLFKCVFWSQGPLSEVYRVRTSTCRALAVASMRKCVRTSLAGTKDCLYNLLVMLTPFEKEESDLECISARSQALYLLALLLPERAASDAVWWELKKNRLMLFDLLLQALKKLQESSLHCITQLARSLLAKKQKCNDSSKHQSDIEYFDNLPSSYSKSDSLSAGDSAREDCQPEYMVEEICKVLIKIYQECSEKDISCASQDARWTTVCTCLCGVLAASARARLYSVHRRLPRATLRALHALRDALSLHAKPADVIRNADHEPMLITLNWVLTLISCLMYECPPAKEHIAEDIAPSLTRLWPWCMMNERLRDTLMNLLVTFTNDCPKAWAAMCSCTGARSLVGELCALAGREAARPRPAALPRALTALAHCAPHHHCRAIMLKNDILSCICKLRARGASVEGGAGAAWARLCAAAGAHADGAAALLALLGAPALRPAPVALLPALAHAAHHHRQAFLQSPDLLDFLSSFLLTGNTKEVVLAARAVWALAANNHRAKLVCRSAGLVSALAAARRRLQAARAGDAARALELLTYTHTILQAT